MRSSPAGRHGVRSTRKKRMKLPFNKERGQIYPPTRKTTPACHNACLREAASAKAGTSACQARPMAVDEYEEDNPPKPCA